MEKIINSMLKHKWFVLAVFVVIAGFCFRLSRFTDVNYALSDYMPESTPSSVAIDVMNEEFDQEITNLRVMLQEMEIPEVLEYKQKLAAVEGVSSVSWLDDQTDLTIPLEVMNESVYKNWYMDGNALLQIAVSEEKQAEAIAGIKEIIKDTGIMSGNAADTVAARASTSSEMGQMMFMVIPLIVIILLFTTTSWLEPVLFLVNIGLALVLNAGTNIFLGEISFITKTTSLILQLACSMDYAIFLLEQFKIERRENEDAEAAMGHTIRKAASSILSSGLTTVTGFAALAIMQFRIGADMGFVLSKGIVFSLLTTLLFMPCLILVCYPLIEKTAHRSFMPSFRLFGKFVLKTRTIVTAALILILVPAVLAQNKLDFSYGMASMTDEESQEGIEKSLINETFGKAETYVLMVPSGETAKEAALNEDIKQMSEVTNIISYPENVGSVIPESYVPEQMYKLLSSGAYDRFVITAQLEEEGDATFAFVGELRLLAADYYGDRWHLAGESVSISDLKDTITSDKQKVNFVSILAIGIILLLTFRSIGLPMILLLTIEAGIFINTAVPYFTDESLNYVGYLIISSVQLGATVDYAILFTNTYQQHVGNKSAKQALLETIQDAAGSIFTSGGILTLAGFIIGMTSSNGIISQLGILIARGTLLSMLSVLFFLPTMLLIREKTIRRFIKKPAKRAVTEI